VDEDIIFEADYVLAADGANSNDVHPFEGFSFQRWKMIGCNVGDLAQPMVPYH
jgi:hypothetical protein